MNSRTITKASWQATTPRVEGKQGCFIVVAERGNDHIPPEGLV